MIKILSEGKAPRAEITCGNCNSVLEYGNADLHVDYEMENKYAMCAVYHQYMFTCPVCGCKVSASWINNK